MAIQQAIQAVIDLRGDGVSTVFKYRLNQLFGIRFLTFNSGNTFEIINPSASLAGITIEVVDGFNGLTVTPTTSGNSFIFTFSAAPTAGQFGEISFTLLFNSQ